MKSLARFGPDLHASYCMLNVPHIFCTVLTYTAKDKYSYDIKGMLVFILGKYWHYEGAAHWGVR